jgi:glutaredoxin
VRVTLYSRPGCHLCDDARAVLVRLGVPFEEVDIDADADLQRVYFIRVPVIEVDGRIVAEGNLHDVPLKDLLERVRR